MSHTLTRRNVSAIAKLDFTGLGHAQRLDAIAKAIGYETGAALMSTLRASEVTRPIATPQPVRAVVAFGSSVVSNIDSGEPLRDEYGNVEGDISEVSFATPGELAAYARGLSDADGWMDTMIVADEVDAPEHPFFKATKDDPKLDFVDWYEAQDDIDTIEQLNEDEKREADARAVEDWLDILIKRAEETAHVHDRAFSSRHPGRAEAEILGYQVDRFKTGENWNDRPSFEILTRETALSDLREAFRANESSYRLLIVRDGDIEEPTFE